MDGLGEAQESLPLLAMPPANYVGFYGVIQTNDLTKRPSAVQLCVYNDCGMRQRGRQVVRGFSVPRMMRRPRSYSARLRDQRAVAMQRLGRDLFQASEHQNRGAGTVSQTPKGF